MNDNMFEGSVMIVAHPDDDILWLSSVIDKVEGILFCFNEDPDNPETGPARNKTIDEYPLLNVASLDVREPQSWNKSNWSQPVATSYGVKLVRSKSSEKRYQETYNVLIHLLRERVAGSKNVYTHNPWGEYGHEEHVLVYRVLKFLQTEFHYDLWFSNYCSNRSVKLMDQSISGFQADYLCLPVNAKLAQEIAAIYKKNNCWTWYEDYRWFEQECLMRRVSSNRQTENELLPYGHSFPVNYIKIDIEAIEPKPLRRVGKAEKIKKKLKIILHHSGA